VCNRAPNMPSFSGPAAAIVNIPANGYAVQAADPDGDNIYYYIDWGDGVTQRIPTSGYYPSNTNANGYSHTWTTAGVKTITAYAVDSSNAWSAPLSYSVSVVGVGQCGVASLSCSSGISGNDNGATTCGTNRSWSCTGENGGNQAWCLYSNPPCTSCTFNGSTVLTGNSVTAYQYASVAYGNTCPSQTRTCTNAVLSGTYAYASCTVNAPASCMFNGSTVLSGSSVTAYNTSSVPYGNTCPSETRTCTNGTLSGSYGYSSCSVSAALGPSAPTITADAGNNSKTGHIETFYFTGADLNTPVQSIRYGIDWNNDNVAEVWTPYLVSGTTQSASNVWYTAGTYTFKALTQNWAGVNSGWTSKTVTITVAPVNGVCGTSAADYLPTVTAFTGSACSSGTVDRTLVWPSSGSNFIWTCLGSNGGTDSGTCTARHLSVQCGSAANDPKPIAPTTSLCNDNSTPTVTYQSSTNKWKWTCGGVTACQTTKSKFNYNEY